MGTIYDRLVDKPPKTMEAPPDLLRNYLRIHNGSSFIQNIEVNMQQKVLLLCS